jgi:hypothetical protein
MTTNLREGGPCCAHLLVEYAPIDAEHGRFSDRWQCCTCQHQFWPLDAQEREAERKVLEARLDEADWWNNGGHSKLGSDSCEECKHIAKLENALAALW